MVTEELRDCSAPSVGLSVGSARLFLPARYGLDRRRRWLGGGARSADGRVRFWWRSFLSASRKETFGCGFCQRMGLSNTPTRTEVFLIADEVREGAFRACEQEGLKDRRCGAWHHLADCIANRFKSMIPTASPPTQDGGTALPCPPKRTPDSVITPLRAFFFRLVTVLVGKEPKQAV